jgi:hypothetical protein
VRLSYWPPVAALRLRPVAARNRPFTWPGRQKIGRSATLLKARSIGVLFFSPSNRVTVRDDDEIRRPYYEWRSEVPCCCLGLIVYNRIFCYTVYLNLFLFFKLNYSTQLINSSILHSNIRSVGNLGKRKFEFKKWHYAKHPNKPINSIYKQCKGISTYQFHISGVRPTHSSLEYKFELEKLGSIEREGQHAN